MKKLPIGIQSFRKLREGGNLYVDKTEHIYKLVNFGSYFFLSRPRRFGKSLTVSTIAELYSGSRELFEGLWIENRWDWSKVHPIVHISFNEIGYATSSLEQALHDRLDEIAAQHGLSLKAATYDQKFRELLHSLSALKGKVVLLIDEYDKPLIDYLSSEQLPIAKAHQQILKNFYSIIKNADSHLELVFITGVSKFSQVSLFSDLNNLDDLTIDENASALTGYTQEELERYFDEWLGWLQQKFPRQSKDALLEDIKTWYDGYTWDGETRLYNPFSILNFFKKRSFEDYWFKTGTPTFLIKKLEERGYLMPEELTVNRALFESYTLDNLELRSLLFQTGYLTIKSIDQYGQYRLGYPNREVEEAMYNHLVANLLNWEPLDSTRPVIQLKEALQANKLTEAVAIINAMLKDVPSHLLADKGEHFYHALVHLLFRYLGLFIRSEEHTSDGRMDAVVHTPSRIFLFEFKIGESAEAALRQIHDKGYADKFRADGKPITLVGINFDAKKRAVDAWQAVEG